MSQADYNIANQSAPDVRSEMNTIFSAIATNNSGATAPTTTFAYQWWYDTTTNILKIRNAADDAWISFATFDQTNDTWYLTKLRVGIGVVPVGGVGIGIEGTHGPNASTSGPHKQYTTATDNYPLFQQMNWAHDNVSQGFDCYFDGTNWKSSDAGSNFRVAKVGDELTFYYDSGVSQGGTISWNEGFSLDTSGNFTVGGSPVGSGKVLQSVEASVATVFSTSSSIPADDTIPQNTEGTELMTSSITPGNASNYLEIEWQGVITGGTGSGNAYAVAALFQDSTANSLEASAIWVQNQSLGPGQQMTLRHRMAAGTTSSTTFKIRIGTTAGTIYINADGSAGTRILGGVMTTRLNIKEISV
jgi:hypothetical protein